MNPVWPTNALYLGPVALWAYWTILTLVFLSRSGFALST